MKLICKVIVNKELKRKNHKKQDWVLMGLLLFSVFLIYRLYTGIPPKSISTLPEAQLQRQLLQDEAGSNVEQIASFSLLVVTVLILCCFLIAYLIRQSGFIYLHESSSTLLFGIILGLIIKFVPTVDTFRSLVTFNQAAFFIYLLPPIIFESGYNMKRKRFFKNFSSVAAFAFIGTTINAFLFAGLLYGMSQAGGFKVVSATSPYTYLECLIFGSLISATDPVTVLAIFKELRVDFDLYANVFGESVFNDAIAIVLYRTVSSFLTRSITFGSFILAIGEFILIFFGSFLIGTIIALVNALLFKYTSIYKYVILEGSFVVLFAYMSYLLADGLELSGIVSILFCGIVMAHYTKNNMSKATQHYTSEMFEVLASISETFVFAYLGMAIFLIDQQYDPLIVIASIFACLVARAAHIFPLSWLVNKTRVHSKIPKTHMLMIWFAGLRGALAFALSLEVPTPNGSFLLTTTLCIVLFTVFLLGGTTTRVLKALKIEIGLDPDLADVEDKEDKNNRFYLLDRYWLKPMFTIAYEPKMIAASGLPDEHDHDDHSSLFVGKNPDPVNAIEMETINPQSLINPDDLEEERIEMDDSVPSHKQIQHSSSLTEVNLNELNDDEKK